eukprot:TRINITY_DN21876_c0_g1_i3.p1 TRINITY_DN21876_c0_g1~~TRINITY_DN21876_c0_g1_i3.p1  ORF type:complete len:776 (+),score=122.36 TRINITY_DN21876_c0_g1_i3:152-2479(+)
MHVGPPRRSVGRSSPVPKLPSSQVTSELRKSDVRGKVDDSCTSTVGRNNSVDVDVSLARKAFLDPIGYLHDLAASEEAAAPAVAGSMQMENPSMWSDTRSVTPFSSRTRSATPQGSLYSRRNSLSNQYRSATPSFDFAGPFSPADVPRCVSPGMYLGSMSARSPTPTPPTLPTNRPSSVASNYSVPVSHARSVTPSPLPFAVGGSSSSRASPSPTMSSKGRPPLERASPTAEPGKKAAPAMRGDVNDPDGRSELLAWCFQRSREQIDARLQLLNRFDVQFSQVVRPGENTTYNGYRRRGDLEFVAKSSVACFKRWFDKAGWKDMPRMQHPASFDSLKASEGACSKTSELVLALANLNFYRWLCRVPEVQLDSYRQELADITLQLFVRRDARVRIRPHSIGYVRRVLTGLENLLKTDLGKSVLIMNHLPSAISAVRRLFRALPQRDYDGGGLNMALKRADTAPQATYDAAHQLQRAVDTTESIVSAMREHDGLWTYRPLLQLVSGRGHVHDSTCAPAIPTPGTSGEASASSGSGQGGKAGRRCRAWGDGAGLVAFRRCLLHPALRDVGMVRRGVRFCIWTPQDVDDEPEELPHEYLTDDVLEKDFLDLDRIDGGGHSARQRKKTEKTGELAKLQKWQKNIERRLDMTNKSQGFSLCFEPAEHRQPTVSMDGGADKLAAIRNLRTIQRPRETPKAVLQQRQEREKQLRKLREVAELDAPDAVVTASEAGGGAEPIMVCYPPPGIAPMDFLGADTVPWTTDTYLMRIPPSRSCFALPQ